MFASSPVLVDPEPHLGDCDPAGLDWEASWDCIVAALDHDDWAIPADLEPADLPLALWSDAAIVAELERLTRWASARGYRAGR